LVSYGQLREAGLSKSAIGRAVQSARLHRVFSGVYALGHPPTDGRARLMAATLACGPGAVVSHRSAAALLGLLDRTPAAVDVIASGDRGRRIDGIRIHMIEPLRRDEAGTVDGIPCTSPARTLVDNAGTAGARMLRSMFERAAAKGMLDLDAIEASIRPGRPGMPALRELIAEWRPAAPVAATGRLKSPLEAMVLPLLTRRSLPAPRCNAPVRLVNGQRIEVDFFWGEQGFVLEADSRDFHATDVAFRRDRWRDRELMRVGYSSLRVPRSQAEDEPEEVADAVFRRLSTS
jgi:hypothetical protein